jgi:beta-glucanase (GH16 family)
MIPNPIEGVILMFRYAVLFLILFVMAGCAREKDLPTENKKQEIPIPEGWILVWNDEFEGNSIDPDKWEHEVNAKGGGNNELQYYTARPQNSFIEDGKLKIRAIKETYTGPEGTREYTSARLRTLNKGDWKYGRFEFRAKMPIGKGIWPALWMLPTDRVYGGWAASGEIDIMEFIGHEPEKVHGTLHYGGGWPQNKYTGNAYTLPAGKFSDDFHVFTLEWEEGEMRWYVDGNLYQTQTEWYSTNGDYPAPFDQRFHLIVNVAVGGNWPGNPDLTTVFPQTMEIDYARVFTRPD